MASRETTTETTEARQVAPVIDEIAAEQAHLDNAYARLALSRREAAALPDVLSPADRGGAHQDRLLRAAAMEFGRRRLETLVTGGSPLCFGRIDTRAREEFHIGRVGVADERGDPLIVDWRAPVAEPFYRATAREPMATRRRRHIRTRAGRVVAIDDEWLDGSSAPDESELALVGEAALMAAVTKARTGQMSDIAATIQAEQDAAIRAPLPGVLVVAGGPGTGKTAVALHRAAYLLYTHRVRLERIGVLVIGPNPVFLHYIEQVLPSLDERAVVLSTPEQLYDRADQTAIDPPAVARLKGDGRMAAVLAAAVTRRQRPLARPAPVPFGSLQLVVSPKASAAIVDRARSRTTKHNDGRIHVRNLLVSHLYRQYVSRLERATPAGQPRREPVAATEFRDALLGARAFRSTLERIWPRLTPEALLGDLFAHAPLLRDAAAGTLADEEQHPLLRPRSSDAPAPPWSAQDLPLLDEAASLLGPVTPVRRPVAAEPMEDAEWMADRVAEDLRDLGLGVDNEMVAEARALVVANVRGPESEPVEAWPREFAHVVVDEAQELSPMQWRMLSRRCPSGSFTVAGDLAQSSGAWSAATWAEALSAVPGGDSAVVAELTVNYRTPKEVMELAGRVLAAARPEAVIPTPLRESGVRPLVERVAARQATRRAVAVAAAERAAIAPGTVALIAPAAMVEGLRAEAERHAETARGDALLLDAPVAVLDLTTAKGLEFDAVVVVEPAELVAEADDGLAALYVALTRTTTRLAIVHCTPLPAPLAAALAAQAGAGT